MKTVTKIESRFELFRVLISISIALLLTFLILILVSADAGGTLVEFVVGPFRSVNRFGNIVESMIPLIFTGTAVSIMYSAKQINLGSEGAFFLGGVLTAYVATEWILPMGVHPVVAMLAGGIIGAIVTGIPAIMFVKFNALPVVSSLMINYVALYLGLFIVNYFLRDPDAGYLASHQYPESSKLPELFSQTNIHLGLIVAVLVLVFAYFFLEKSKWGYEIKRIGENSNFAKYSGINVTGTIVLAQVVGGFIAGLGGAVEQLGMYTRFQYQTLPQLGFDGVVIAVLSRYKPTMIPLAAFFLAYIRTGADVISRTSDVPVEIVSIIQSLIIILVASERFLSHWKERVITEQAMQTEEGA